MSAKDPMSVKDPSSLQDPSPLQDPSSLQYSVSQQSIDIAEPDSQDSQTEANLNEIGSTKELLKVPAFQRLLTAWTAANLGDSALFLSIAIWVKSLTGSDTSTAFIFVAIGLPALCAPVFGLLADRFSRVKLITLSHVLISLAVLALFLVEDAKDLWIIYAVTVAYSCTSYLNAASQSGLLKDTIDTKFLAPANGIFTSIDYGFRIIVPLFAAGAFALWGIEPVLAFTIVSFLLSAVFMQFLGIKETQNDVSIDRSWLKTSLEGFPALRAHKTLWVYVLALTIVIATGGALNAIVFPVLEQGLGLGPEFVSVFTSVQGVAAVSAGAVGALLMKRLSTHTLMLSSLIAFTVAFGALAIPHPIAVGVAFALLGFAMPLMAMVVMTIKQTDIPMELQGRTGAAINVLFSLPQVMVSALVAVLLGVFPYWVFIAVGGVLSLAGLLPILRFKTSAES